jgi:hypothetical protein
VLIGKREGAWRMDFVKPSLAFDRVGRDLMAAFQRCFNVVEKLKSFSDLLSLSHGKYQHDEAEGDRNQWVIGTLLPAEMYEMAKAIQGLASAGVRLKVAPEDHNEWVLLNDLRGRWHSDPAAAEIRNQVGHHPGKLAVFRKGIDAILSEQPERLAFYVSGGSGVVAGHAVLALESLVRGLDLSQEQLEELIERTVRDVRALPKLLMDLFLSVVAYSGVGIDDART